MTSLRMQQKQKTNSALMGSDSFSHNHFLHISQIGFKSVSFFLFLTNGSSAFRQNSNLSAQDHENIIVVSSKFPAADGS